MDFLIINNNEMFCFVKYEYVVVLYCNWNVKLILEYVYGNDWVKYIC